MFSLVDLEKYLEKATRNMFHDGYSPMRFYYKEKDGRLYMDVYIWSGKYDGDVHIGTIDENFNIKTSGTYYPFDLSVYFGDENDIQIEDIGLYVLNYMKEGIALNRRYDKDRIKLIDEIAEAIDLELCDTENEVDIMDYIPEGTNLKKMKKEELVNIYKKIMNDRSSLFDELR